MIGISLQFLEVDMKQANEFEAIAFAQYVAGLRDAGWEGDVHLARYDFAASAALYIGVGGVAPYLKSLWDDEREGEQIANHVFGCSLPHLFDQSALLQSYLLDLDDEARTLLNELGLL